MMAKNSLPIRVHLPKMEHTSPGFEQGHPRYGGRRKGSRNKIGGDLRQMIMDAATETGYIEKDKDGNPIATGREGCKGWLKWLYLHEPKTAAALLARTLPYFITVAEQSPVATRAEIEQEFLELGLPKGLIDYLQKAPVELQKGENPDPWGLHSGKANVGVPVDAKDVTEVKDGD